MKQIIWFFYMMEMRENLRGIISANVLTTIRTAAVSAFATKHLAISEPQEIGIVSPGKN